MYLGPRWPFYLAAIGWLVLVGGCVSAEPRLTPYEGGPGVLSGCVSDARSMQPIKNAVVYVHGVGREVERTGCFSFLIREADTLKVYVTALAYTARTDDVWVPAGVRTIHNFALTRAPSH